MPRKQKDRVTLRSPEDVGGLGKRIRQALTSLGVQQQELAEEMGGYREDTISAVINGKSSRIAIDLGIRLAEFMQGRGVSLPWLFMGIGAMMLADELAGVGPKITVEDFLSYAMLIAVGKKLGVDLKAIADAWSLDIHWPGRGIFSLPVYSLADKIEQAIPGWDRPKEAGDRPAAIVAVPGYRTVPSEDVPTSPDWWKSYVPVIGRVAAGEGIDAAEAAQYPPAWAGEFVEYRGGPPTAVAVRVAGESMLPTYSQDDMLIVDTARQAENGKVCCVLVAVDGFREARVKKLVHHGRGVVLESLNPAWPPEKMAAERILAAYAIVAHLPRIVR